MSSSPSVTQQLSRAVAAIVEEFEVSRELLNEVVGAFQSQARTSLGPAVQSERALPMIPTFVTGMPTGKETGLYLAADLGGTNFRVCSVELDGNHGHQLKQIKCKIPDELLVSTSEEFFDHLALQVKEFLETHHDEHLAEDNCGHNLRMGFTFSFPVQQTSINSGTLIRWTKSFDIKDAVGKDVCAEFQRALDKLELRVHVSALINDTLGSLMARAYSNTSGSRTIVGTIFGTGTNACYFEKVANIHKLPEEVKNSGDVDQIMAVNTEWGSFDNDLSVLPTTRFDEELDKDTPNRSFHMFEKRISGLYVGDLTRRILLELQERGLILQGPLDSNRKPEPLRTKWAVDTSLPSVCCGDHSPDLRGVGDIVRDVLGYETNAEERAEIRRIAMAVGKRSAYLAGAAVSAIFLMTKSLDDYDVVDMGGDGSVIELFPNYREMMREAMRLTSIGARETHITLGLAQDGSGIGAALCARLAQEAANKSN